MSCPLRDPLPISNNSTVINIIPALRHWGRGQYADQALNINKLSPKMLKLTHKESENFFPHTEAFEHNDALISAGHQKAAASFSIHLFACCRTCASLFSHLQDRVDLSRMGGRQQQNRPSERCCNPTKGVLYVYYYYVYDVYMEREEEEAEEENGPTRGQTTKDNNGGRG